jgi:hypothetical protein
MDDTARQDEDVATESLVFRYGADMDPQIIVAETPGARFVARARMSGDAVTGEAETGDEVWGILLIQPEPPASDREADVVTDDGHLTHAAVLTGREALDDPTAVVTQARYWELSPAYIARLIR